LENVICDICRREFPREQTPSAHEARWLCEQCRNLVPTAVHNDLQSLRVKVRGAGLTGFTQARSAIYIGAALSCCLAGLPILLWGAIAEHQMRAQLRRQGYEAAPVGLWTLGIAIPIVLAVWAVVALIIHAAMK
jgi:hypothetical protein